MNADTENDASKRARNHLSAFCRTRDRATRIRWILAVCGALLLIAFVLALIDYWWLLPGMVRSVGALALVALAVIGIMRLVHYYRRPTGLKKGALDIESKRPEIGCEISTAAEYLSGERKIIHEYEPELVAALEARAAQKLGANPVDYRKGLRLHGAALGFSLLGLLVLVIAVPPMLTAFHRTAIPFSKAHYTTVEVRPGNIEIPIGRDLEVTNVFSGRLPKRPRLEWQESGNPEWRELVLTKPGAGTYTLTLTNLRADTSYRVAGGDAISETYKITAYEPPAVKDLTVVVKSPDYTGLKPAIQKTPDIVVVRASTAQMEIEPSVALAGAKLRFSASPELAMAPTANGSWTASLQITNETDYWIELTDKKGHNGVNERPFHIRALPDNPPKIEITEPGQDTRASNTNKVLVKMSVTDDFGVEEIRLVANKLGGAQKVIPAKRESVQNGEIIATAELDLSTLGVKDYELVAYHAEAVDNNTLDGPGVGRSPVYFVEITNEEGRPSLSQGNGQRVNLLVIEKQIIADSTALDPKAKPADFEDLAARQRDAAEFGRMYLDALEGGGAPAAATSEMQGGLKDMARAASRLKEKDRSDALPAEEGALAHLYQVLKLLPELENLPTQPRMANQQPPASPKLNVVLEAIKQRKKGESNNQEVEEALKEAQELASAQSALNSAMRSQPGGDSPKASDGESTQSASNSAMGSQPGGDSPKASDGESTQSASNSAMGSQPGSNSPKASDKESTQSALNSAMKSQPGSDSPKASDKESKSNGNAANSDESQSSEAANAGPTPNPQQLAESEMRLSEEAARLAEKLRRLAGKNSRLGHNAGNNAKRAASTMASAGKAIGRGNLGQAGEQGFEGEVALRGVIAQLERFLKNQPEPSDIANEDYPKAYEALISEYLKKLSHSE